MRSFARVAVSLFLSAVPFMACSSAEPTTQSAPASGGVYRGLLTGPKETGVLDVTLAGDTKTLSRVGILANGTPTSVSGTIAIAGGTVTLSGSFDSATGQLTLTGTTANGTYALTGTTSSSGFTGTYSGPNGSAGVWSLTSAATGAAELYCGTYSTAAGQLVGVFNLVIGSGVGTGARCDAKDCGALTATVSGTTITISDPSQPNKAPSTGTISGGTVSGTIPGANGGGTFTGSTSACAEAPPPPPPVDGGTDASITDAGADAAAVLETIAANVNDPVALSLDATHVYWLSGGDAAIRRCPLAGCGAGPETVVSALSVSSSVAADNGTIYWTSGFRYLMTCAVGVGGTCTPAQFTDLGASVNAYPAHLWVTGTRLYWVAENAQVRMIQTCPLAGCTTGYPKTVYTSASGSLIHNAPLAGLVVNATDAYLTSYTGGVFRFPMTNAETATAGNGTQVQPSAFSTSGLDLDGTTMRWGLLGDGKIVQCTTPTCTTVTDFVANQLAPGGTRSNAAYVYGFNRGTPKVGEQGYNTGTGSVWRVKKP